MRHLVHRPHEHLEPDDGVDDDDEDDEEGDLHQGQQGHHYSVQHNLETKELKIGCTDSCCRFQIQSHLSDLSTNRLSSIISFLTMEY